MSPLDAMGYLFACLTKQAGSGDSRCFISHIKLVLCAFIELTRLVQSVRVELTHTVPACGMR
jgi:hypothetical protein